MKNQISITFFGDSFMSYYFKGKKYSWVENTIKSLKKDFKKKISFNKNIINGISSRGVLDILPNFFFRIQQKEILIFQFGMNDSWHYNSLKGLANVDIITYKKNLEEILKKSKKYGFKKILFVGYHGVAKKRVEGNSKTINSNLSKYKLALKLFCKKNKIIYIDPKLEIKKSFSLDDEIHLNKKGVQHYSSQVNKVLRKVINEEI